MSNYSKDVPMNEQPDATPENIPDDVLKRAIEMSVAYGECPECGERQFHPTARSHSLSWKCVECRNEMRVVG